MKRYAISLSLVIAATVVAPAALAGGDIVKCVNAGGRVTLTDQPCDAGAVTLSTSVDRAAATPARGEARRPALYRHTVSADTLRNSSWHPSGTPAPTRLAGDIATLKAARLQMELLDSEAKSARLAGLN